MRILFVLVSLLVACTKPNPNRCCTDEADCKAADVPLGQGCDQGLSCRGHMCVEETCVSRDQCDLAAPYCVVEAAGTCSAMCTDDSQCPGFEQATTQTRCEGGACVECRAAGNDCSGASPVCSGGRCVPCTDNSECASGACAPDGSCVVEANIAYVSTSGSTSSECTHASPCTTIERALAISPVRRYIVIAAGTYSRASTIDVVEPRSLIGVGSSRPVITRSTPGPILTAHNAADLTLDHVELSGAIGVNNSPPDVSGWALYCIAQQGAPVVHVRDSVLRANAASAMKMRLCTFSVETSSFLQNGFEGIETTDSTGSIARSTFSGNGDDAVHIDGGLYTVTNNMVVRNAAGINLFSDNSGNRVEFNTIADNTGTGFQCTITSQSTSFPNNLIARNGAQFLGSNCTLPGAVVVDTNIAPLHFKSPDAAPYDYHLTHGSIAIDMASISTQDHDFDGETRPKGAGRDVGADEAE